MKAHLHSWRIFRPRLFLSFLLDAHSIAYHIISCIQSSCVQSNQSSCRPTFFLQHDQSNAAHVLGTRLVPRIDAAANRRRAVVVQVVMQRAISGAELLFLEEERVIEQREGVEDIEASLVTSVSLAPHIFGNIPSSTKSTHPSSTHSA